MRVSGGMSDGTFIVNIVLMNNAAFFIKEYVDLFNGALSKVNLAKSKGANNKCGINIININKYDQFILREGHWFLTF